MNPSNVELIKILADLGGTVVIAAIVLYLIYKSLIKVGIPLVESQQNTAAALGQQAQCMVDMQKTIDHYVCRDNDDHREILLATQVVITEVQALTNEVKRYRHEFDRHATQHHPPDHSEDTGAPISKDH